MEPKDQEMACNKGLASATVAIKKATLRVSAHRLRSLVVEERAIGMVGQESETMKGRIGVPK